MFFPPMNAMTQSFANKQMAQKLLRLRLHTNLKTITLPAEKSMTSLGQSAEPEMSRNMPLLKIALQRFSVCFNFHLLIMIKITIIQACCFHCLWRSYVRDSSFVVVCFFLHRATYLAHILRSA
jgi:hypothetical protein